MDFCQSLVQLKEKFLDVDVNQLEVIFVSDGIAEDIPHLQEACRRFDFAKYIAFTRNFGQHIAISCGLVHSTGDLVCYMDVDMEDPPSELPHLIRELETSNSEICVGLRIGKKVSFMSRLTSRLFHGLLTKLTGLSVPANGTTMRVMTRSYLNAFVGLHEKERYLPGIEAWLGHKTSYLPIVQQARTQGKPSYDFRKKLRLAISAVLSFSDLPLRMVVRIGFYISALSFVMGVLSGHLSGLLRELPARLYKHDHAYHVFWRLSGFRDRTCGTLHRTHIARGAKSTPLRHSRKIQTPVN